MTMKEAAKKFNLDEKELRNRRKAEMILGVHKEGRYIVIPDETEIIPSKQSIQTFLLQILKKKNNEGYIFPRNLCSDKKDLAALLHYLFVRGFIGEYDTENPETVLHGEVCLTEEGIEYIFGQKKYQALNASMPVNLSFSIVSASAQVACACL